MWKLLGGLVTKRVATGLVVTLLLGGGAYWWVNFKDGLREEGRIECAEGVNRATYEALQTSLMKAVEANKTLAARARELATLNEEKSKRVLENREKITDLLAQMEALRNEDPEYKTWGNMPLPDLAGTRERLRQASGGNLPGNAD